MLQNLECLHTVPIWAPVREHNIDVSPVSCFRHVNRASHPNSAVDNDALHMSSVNRT